MGDTYDLDSIVEMNHSCHCGSNKWKIIRVGSDIRIKCMTCGASILMPRYSFEQQLKCLSDFSQIPEDQEQLEKLPNKYRSMIDLLKDATPIFHFQLVDIALSHNERHHFIENKTVLFVYEDKEEHLHLFSYDCYYCNNCKVYFDNKENFLSEMKQHSIQPEKLRCLIEEESRQEQKERDKQYGNHHFSYDKLNEESILHYLGYRVGASGLLPQARKELLRLIIDKQIMSKREIESFISKNIEFFSHREEYQRASRDWNEDLQYLTLFSR